MKIKSVDIMGKVKGSLLSHAPVDPFASSIVLDISAHTGTIVDAKGHTITNTGVTTNTTVMKDGTSMYFDGTKYLTVPNTDSALWLTGDFTIESWVYLINKTAPFAQLFGNYETWPQANGLQLFMGHSSASGGTTYADAIAGSFPAINSSDTVIYGSWFHYAAVRHGSTITNYINGNNVGFMLNNSVPLYGSKTRISIGCPLDSLSSGGMHGYLDRLRVTNAARYTANFTPATF